MPPFLSALIAFAGWLVTAAGFTAAFVAVYTRLTPHREFDLIVREHNTSAALALGASLLGFAIPLARAMAQSVSIVEFVVWAIVAFAVQLLAYAVARFAHPDLSRAIEADTLSAALWLGAVSLAAGLLSAAAMTG